jgi:hypothetical protein
MITNVSTRQSLIILFFFYCEREERENWSI